MITQGKMESHTLKVWIEEKEALALNLVVQLTHLNAGRELASFMCYRNPAGEKGS